METEPKPPKLTDEQRQARFVEVAREVEASEEPEALDRAFERVARAPEKLVSDDD